MDCVVAPVFHKYPAADEAVRRIELPAIIVSFLAGVTVGVIGSGVTVTTVDALTDDVQPFKMVRTEKLPAALTVIDWEVAPLDHK